MKKLIPHIVITMLLAPVLFLLASSITASAQEYDDMYFTAGDRKKAKFLKESESLIVQTEVDSLEELDAKTLNPDNLVQYNRGVSDKRRKNQATESEYYVEEETGNVIINNYYGRGYSNYYYNPYSYYSPYSRWGYDPFFDPFYYGPSWGWNSGWHISIGYSSYRRPYYYNPWGYNYYDSYYGYGYHRPYYGGYYPYRSYGYATYSKNQVYYNRESSSYQVRNVTRGNYTPRSSSTAVTGDGTRRSVSSTSGTQSTSGRIANYRDHNQNDYYRRTRSDVSSTTSSVDQGARRTTQSATGSSLQNSSNTAPNARLTDPARRSTEYYNTRSVNPRSTTAPNNNNTYRPTESGNRNNTVTPPTTRPTRSVEGTPSRSPQSTAPARTYTPSRSNEPQRAPARTTPSRSGGSESYSPARSNSGNNSYTPSRSNSSGSSYTPSRSNSGSSGSSYTPSRSSSGSSGSTPSRSSSGSSSDGGSGGSRRAR